jgi:hypothetical protein
MEGAESIPGHQAEGSRRPGPGDQSDRSRKLRGEDRWWCLLYMGSRGWDWGVWTPAGVRATPTRRRSLTTALAFLVCVRALLPGGQ